MISHARRWLTRGADISDPVFDGAWQPDFAREERASYTYMFQGRVLVLGLLAIWVTFSVPAERSVAYLSVLSVFFLFGAVPYALSMRGYGGTQVIAFFLFLDASVLSYLLIFPNPYGLEGWSPQMNLRAPGFLYLGLFLVYMALSYKPILVIWAGVAAAVSWTIGYAWVINLPETNFFSSRDILGVGLSLQDALDRVLDPYAVGFARLVNQVVFLLTVTLVLTLTVWRSRQLVLRQLASESQRTALSRYFSPNLVRELTKTGRSLGQPKVQPVAVLFADMVGFTAISERLSPVELVDLLRTLHGKLARVALDHGGTIDKFIGDAIMVHFGTPEPGHDDAERALRCAKAMLNEIDVWNAAQEADRLEPIRIGIGLHFGDVIVGNIGDQRRLEYTVLGDTVNVASRLEGFTRKLQSPFVTSDSLVAAVKSLGGDPQEILPGLKAGATEVIRGRKEPVRLWYCDASSDPRVKA